MSDPTHHRHPDSYILPLSRFIETAALVQSVQPLYLETTKKDRL